MLKDILDRIDARLTALGLAESRAAKDAGLSDSAIRDMRRALKAGREEAGVSTTTLMKLAPVLETTGCWLLTGECDQLRTPAEIAGMLQRIEGLKPENVTVLLSAIDGFQRANAAQPSQAQPEDRSEPGTPRRQSSPSL